jgi:uncharacterized protein
MKLALLVAFVLASCGGTPVKPAAPAADKLEMRSYFFVLLRRGPAWTPEKTPETRKIFEGHMANIEAMAKSGKLLLAGPMDAPDTDPTAVAGIFVFDVKDRAEVDALLAADPAITIQRLVPEVLTWYGPAGLTYPGKVP